MSGKNYLVLWVVALAIHAGSGAPAWAAESRAPQAETALSRLAEIDWEHWDGIKELLTDVHQKTGIPAIAAVYVKDGKIVDQATVGLRQADRPAMVLPDDPFHLGSVTKSMTATVIGRLVEKDLLSWTMTLAELLPDIPMRDEYRSVTVENLLQHRAGLPAYTHGPPPGAKKSRDYTGTPVQIRAAFVADLLMQNPTGVPGETFLYSNAGYTLIGHVAERLTGQSWEELMEKHLFTPLGMTTCGFGFPEQPAGHHGPGPDFTPTRPAQYPPMDIVAPAGNVHCSARDLGLYALLHLSGLAGNDGYLQTGTIRQLHTPPSGSDSSYAAGWWIRHEAGGAQVHQHGGTVSSSYAELRIDPQTNTGVAVLVNVGSTIGEPVTNKLARTILARSRSPQRATMTIAAGGEGSSGFVTRESTSASGKTSAPKIRTGTATPEDDAQVWRLMRALARSINDEDLDAYLSLFAEPKKQENVFEFMAGQVLPVRGSILSFHELSPPIQIEGDRYPIRAATFHLENGFPGYLGISVDDAGKIDHFSLFVKGDLCPNGVDPLCEKSVVPLDEP